LWKAWGDLRDPPSSIRSEKMDIRKKNATWQDSVTEAASLIILQSKERMWKIKGPYQPEHRAYMSLVVSIEQAIKAFVALDESLK
jgi:hypothetical protein